MAEQIAKGIVKLGEDFTQHRVQGWVPHAASRGMDPNLDVPLISHVHEGLWQGGCMHGVVLPADFDLVLSLYPWEQYTLTGKTKRHEVKLYDSLDQEVDAVDGLADLVVRQLKKDQTVLVHCQAGLNRSGLVAAVVLVKLGFTPDDAIRKLRESRCELVLSNEAFENHVRSLA